jgi:hypothetical protein
LDRSKDFGAYDPLVTAPDVLAFADRKTDGAYAVTEPSGTVVALIRVNGWTGRSFEASRADGEPLCSGRSRGMFSTWWDVRGADDRLLASLKASFAGARKQVRLSDERALTIEGRWFTRDWAMRDESGGDVLSLEPTTGAWSFRPDAWVVRSHDASLGLDAVVGIVEVNRLMVKAARSSTAATAT